MAAFEEHNTHESLDGKDHSLSLYPGRRRLLRSWA
jgi:hypothetical protein